MEETEARESAAKTQKKPGKLKTFFNEYKRISFEPYAAIVLFLYLIHPLVNVFLQIFYWVQKKYLWCFMNDYIYVIIIISAVVCFVGIMLLSEQHMNHKRSAEKYPGTVRKVFRKESLVSIIMFLILAAWEFIATAVTGFEYSSFFENDYGNYGYIGFILCYFLWFTCAAAIRSDAIRMKLMKTGVWVAAIATIWNALLCLFLNLNIKGEWYTFFIECINITTGWYGREKLWILSGGFFNQNHYGYYIALMCAVCGGIIIYEKSLKKRITYSIILAIISFGLTGCNTFGSWLAAFLGMILLIIGVKVKDGHFSKWSVLAFVIFWAVTFFADIWMQHVTPSILQFFTDIGSIASDPQNADDAGTARWGLWKKSFEDLIPYKPVFGYGVLNYVGDMSKPHYINNSPHNEIIEYALTYGLPAACMYVFTVLFIFFRNLKYRKKLSNGAFIAMAGAFTYFVSSFFGVLFLYSAPFFFIFLGMGICDSVYPDGVLPAPEKAVNQELIDAEVKKQVEEYRKKREAAEAAAKSASAETKSPES